MARTPRNHEAASTTTTATDPYHAKVEATALANDAEIVGGALVGNGCNYGMYVDGVFVASAEGLAMQAALDAAEPPPAAE